MAVVRSRVVVMLFAALSLSAVNAWAGGANDRLNETFFVYDDKCEVAGEEIENFAWVRIGGVDGERFSINGSVDGFGTDGDLVAILYSTDLPNKVSATDKSGSVSQKEWSELCIIIDQVGVVGGRDFDDCEFVEKCEVNASVKLNSGNETIKGSASANCSGTDLYGLLSPDQLASVLAAFPKGNACGVKLNIREPGKKSTFSIKANDKDALIADPG